MTNSNYTPENDHEREKLRFFSSYVDRYLNILLIQPFVKSIDIYDMFAGRGMYGKDTGSAELVLETIRKHQEKQQKEARLNLSDSNAASCKILNKVTNSDINKWVSCQQVETNDAINKYLEDVNHKIYKLFYLNPFGYSQIEKETLESIINIPHVECLLFVPVSSVMDEKIPSIKKFLNEYGIDTSTYEKADWHALRSIIKDTFAKIYSERFVSMAELSVSEHKYALYFIGNNVRGLDKFLDIATKLKSEDGHQIELIVSKNEEIINYLSEGTKTNVDLYFWGIKQEWIPSKTNEVLANLENEQKITVRYVGKSKKRGKNIFYLGYNYYKHKRIEIEVSLVK